MTNDIELIKLTEVFKGAEYRVPIYQRNYEWGEDDIKTLISDIYNNDTDCYFVGTLVVDADDHGKNVYEVIDGQQRLTTLYLVQTYLSSYKQKDSRFDFDYIKGKLCYEARNVNFDALDDPKKGKKLVSKIKGGYEAIKDYFESKESGVDVEDFYEKFQKSFLIRVQVPEKTDLNQYFEIMNTRGEQLKPHQIIKARILSKLSKDERKAAAVIWDCCSDIDSYVQMNFNKTARNGIFGEEDWTSEVFKKSWEEVQGILDTSYEDENVEKLDENTEEHLVSLLKETKKDPRKYCKKEDEDTPDDEGSKKSDYESIISFPNFLLQVNAIDAVRIDESEGEKDDDPSLDDSNFIKILEEGLWGDIAETLDKDIESRKRAKNFLIKLLRCRVLFDMYVLKRDTKGDSWSLKKLQKYVYEADGTKEETKNEVFTFGKNDTDRLRRLQSALRITYTSPKTMRWITKVLRLIWDNATSGKGNDNPEEIIKLLEDYCRGKIIQSDYKNKRGFEIKRIVFTYLDYLLLYNEKYKHLVDSDWEFQYRTSIEHFSPQHPRIGIRWDDEPLNIFGNLALITTEANSLLIDAAPIEKIKEPKIMKQSVKLARMAEITENEGWTPNTAEKHGDEMLKILEDDTNKLCQ